VEANTIQIRRRGVITLPAKLRQRHNLEPGDTLTLIDLGGAFFVVPKVSLVPKLAAEIEWLRQEAGLSIEDLLEGLDEQRRRYYREKKCTSA
jgi:AbrB family looped-hinge helix DNA binding protein